MHFIKATAAIAALTLFTFSCTKEKNDPVIPNEEELITTLKYTLVEQGGPDTVQMVFQDIDGPGGTAPVVIGGTLKANTTYLGTIQLLNEQANPAEDITIEVANEAEEHQFFFQQQTLNVKIKYQDADQDGNPIGIETELETTNAISGKLIITLRHEPNKNAAGVAQGDLTNAGGETDIQVTFNVDVK